MSWSVTGSSDYSNLVDQTSPLSCAESRPIRGLCVRGSPGGWCPDFPRLCDPINKFTAEPGGSTSSVGGDFGSRVECPAFMAVQAVCISSATYSCSSGAVSLDCRENVEVPVRPESCEWRGGGEASMGSSRGLQCGDDEAMVALCVSSNGAACEGTGPTGISIRCCLTAPPGGCAPRPAWVKDMTTTCPAYSSVTAACSSGCDPWGEWADTTVRAVPAMFFCQGLVFTSSTTTQTSCRSAGQWASCGGNEVIVGVTNGGCSGTSFRAACRKLRFSQIMTRECITVAANGSAWCPKDYSMTSVCAPNVNHTCVNASNTAVLCCRVQSNYQGGNPCRLGFVYTVAGGVNARSGVYGVGTEAAIGTSLRRPGMYGRSCFDCAEVLDTQLHVQTNVLYMLVNRRVFADPTQNMAFIMSTDMTTGNSQVTQLVAGSLTASGYSTAGRNESSGQWTLRNFTLGTETGGSLMLTPAGLLYLVEGFGVRVMLPQEPFWAQLFSGIPSTTGTFFNRTVPIDARYPQIRFTRFWPKTEQLFISAARMIVDYRFAVMNFFVGDGVALADQYVSGRFRTEQRVLDPAAMIIYQDRVMYFAESSVNSAIGGIVMLDLDTGLLRRLTLTSALSPYSMAIFKPQDIRSNVRMYCTSLGSAISVVDLVTGEVSIFAGSTFSNNYVDNTRLSDARFNIPKTVMTTDTHLYISDTSNTAVRAVMITPCSLEYNATKRCIECSDGYFHYPRCRNVCTIEDDCRSRASSVSGSQPNSCTCVCTGNFRGQKCDECRNGLDRNFACTTCLKGYVGQWPNCRSPSISISTTISLTNPPTRTLTLRPNVTTVAPPPPSPTADPTTAPPTSDSPTPMPAPYTPGGPGGPGGPPIGPPGSPPPCFGQGCTKTRTIAAMVKRRTKSLSLSSTREPIPPTPTRTLPPSKSRSASATGTGTMPPVPHGMVRRFVNGTWKFFTKSATVSLSSSGSRSRPKTRTPDLPTPAPPRPSTTPRPPGPPGPPGPNVTGGTPGPAGPTVTGPHVTQPNVTERTLPPAPTVRPTLPPLPPIIPPEPPRISAIVRGRVTVDSIMDGGDVADRSLTLTITNAQFDPERCQARGALRYSYDPRRDLSFLEAGAVWCNASHMTIVFPPAPRADAPTPQTVGIILDGALRGNASFTADFTVEPKTVSAAAQAAQTAATATSIAVSSVSGGGATEIQGMALMGMVSCADPRMKGVMQSARSAISPWQLGDDEIGFLLGNFAITAIACAVMGGITGVLYLKFKHDHDSGKQVDPEEFPDPTEDEREQTPLNRALTTMSMPGKLHAIFSITHQGICLESHMRLNDPYRTTTGLLLGIFGLVYSLAIPAGLVFLMKKQFRGKCYRYKYVQDQVPFVVRMIIPKAFWMPVKYTKRFGCIYEDYFNTDIYLAVYDPLIKINLVSLVAALQINPGAGCSAQYGVLGIIYVLEALYRIIRWPNTTTAGNVSPIAACITTAMIASTAGFSYSIISTEVAMLLQSYLSVACNLLAAVLMTLDRFVWQKREIKARYENGDFDFVEHGSEEALKEDEAKAGDGDENDSSGGSDDDGKGGKKKRADKEQVDSPRSRRGRRQGSSDDEMISVQSTRGRSASRRAVDDFSGDSSGEGGSSRAKMSQSFRGRSASQRAEMLPRSNRNSARRDDDDESDGDVRSSSRNRSGSAKGSKKDGTRPKPKHRKNRSDSDDDLDQPLLRAPERERGGGSAGSTTLSMLLKMKQGGKGRSDSDASGDDDNQRSSSRRGRSSSTKQNDTKRRGRGRDF